jgi:hypothetical protein
MAVRSQSGRSQTIQQIATPQNTGLTNVDVTEFSYWNVRLLSKLGVEVDLSPFTFGVTFTTPSVDIVGKGEVLVNKGTTAISPLDSTFVTDVSATSQKDLTSAYKSAPAVALGASYSVGATTFYGTAEWNGGIGEYAILNASDYVGQTSGDTLSVDVNYELKPVLNWGLGLERQFRDWFHFYGAFFVDRSALPEDNDDVVTVALAQWDILHVTGGFAFSVGRVDLTLGLSYGWGSEQIRKPFTVPGESPTAKLNYQSLKLILGFAAAF